MALRMNLIMLSAATLLIAGCGRSSDGPPLAPVSGTVNFKGQPLAKGEIVFYPAEGRSARGDIENGNIINVSTFKPGDGAPLGDLKVAVFATEPDPADPSGMGVKSRIPTKYNDPQKSNLSITVKTGEKNAGEFNLTE